MDYQPVLEGVQGRYGNPGLGFYLPILTASPCLEYEKDEKIPGIPWLGLQSH